MTTEKGCPLKHMKLLFFFVLYIENQVFIYNLYHTKKNQCLWDNDINSTVRELFWWLHFMIQM